jgi:hypothetical protein
MTSAINSLASNAYNMLPKIRIDSMSNILAKTKAVAIPALLLMATSNAQCTDALLSMYVCVTCLATGGGPLCIPPCIVAAVLLPVPLA